MDRMSFIPGTEAREEIVNAEGHLSITRDAVGGYVDEFAPSLVSGPGGNILYSVLLATLSVGDKLDIYTGLRDYNEGEEKDPGGELVGFTWVTLTEANGAERKLWEVGRRTSRMDERFAIDAFNLYRASLSSFKNAGPPEMRAFAPPTDRPPEMDISRAFSPSNLAFCSGIMFYFVVFSNSAPSRPDFFNSPRWLSRPMRAFDALVMSALLTLAVGAPPLVFAVVQDFERLGVMPESFNRIVYAETPEGSMAFPAEGISIVL